MSLFDSPAFENHESVHAFSDAVTGLKCVIAVHSTARGPAAGGCRLFPYASEQAAIDDALRLSRAMSHKNAVADLDLGGGKAVIIGDPRQMRSGALFEAFGRAVEALGGRYWTAEDVGVSPGDLAYARRATRFVAGLEGHAAASGDPSPVTAEGVFRGVELCVGRRLGRTLAGVKIAIQGVGHVGAYLADKLHAAGAHLVIADVDAEAVARVAARTDAQVAPPEAIFDAEVDVFAPCAMGGAITRATIGRLRASVIAGGANNQLGEPDAGGLLVDKGVLYAPDFVINGGGIINVAAEIRGLQRGEPYDRDWVEAKLARLMATLEEVLDSAKAERRTPHEVAVAVAEARIAAAKRG